MSDHTPQIKRRQHTVPRCYLRGFANEQQRFFSFNKRYRSVSEAGVGGSACADFFYDFHPSTLAEPDDDPQWVENTLSKLEGRFREVLDACINEARAGRLTVENASYLAQFVALQWMRTTGARNTLVEADAKLSQEMVNQWYRQHYPDLPPGRFTRGPGYEQALHASMMLDYPSVITFAERFWNLFWVVGRNRTDQPLYTSDEPVVRHRYPPENDSPQVPPGIGIEYAFPLNPEFVLIMTDRYMLRQLTTDDPAQYERTTVELERQAVDWYNAMQVVQSTQYVLCSERKFELADRLCRENPRICDPDRERVQLDFTEGDGGGGWSLTVLG